MAFHRKYEHLLALQPDIAIIPECANIDLITKKAPGFSQSSSIWIGDNKQKGLGVFTFGAFVGKKSPIYLDQFPYILPMRIDGPTKFNLVAVWACHSKKNSYEFGLGPLRSALLAEQGFDGPPEPLAGVQGFYNAMGVPPNLSLATDGLGGSWEILATSYKPYPCGFVIHPVLDCVLDWRCAHPNADVTRVVIRGNPLLSDRTDRPNIASGRESQVSVQHAVAAALVYGKAGLEQFSDACVRNPKVQTQRSKVEVVRDPAFSTIAAAVEITTADGKTERLTQEAARGSDANPMSDQDLEDKLRTAAVSWNPRQNITPLIDAIWALDKSGDVSGLAALSVPEL